MLVWMPLFGPLPKPPWFGDLAQFAYVVAFRFGGLILVNVLFWSGAALYPAYGPGAETWGLSALTDQRIGAQGS